RRRHTRSTRDWSSDVCSSDLEGLIALAAGRAPLKTGVCPQFFPVLEKAGDRPRFPGDAERAARLRNIARQALVRIIHARVPPCRSEERRVGKEWKVVSALQIE